MNNLESIVPPLELCMIAWFRQERTGTVSRYSEVFLMGKCTEACLITCITKF